MKVDAEFSVSTFFVSPDPGRNPVAVLGERRKRRKNFNFFRMRTILILFVALLAGACSRRTPAPAVVRPVKVTNDAISTLKKKLLPIATVLTPNIPEGEVLSGMKIENENDMVEAAKFISEKFDCAVLMKGGHQINDANDLLYRNGDYKWFTGKRIDNPNTHGTGCTLSSAIASNLAKGYDLDKAVLRAKDYISGALAAMLDLGKGSGPMNHAFACDNEFMK